MSPILRSACRTEARASGVGDEVLTASWRPRIVVEIEQGLAEPAPQQAGAHRRAGLVEHGNEAVAFLAARAFRQLQVAPRLERPAP